jgi:hypothetical protein
MSVSDVVGVGARECAQVACRMLIGGALSWSDHWKSLSEHLQVPAGCVVLCLCWKKDEGGVCMGQQDRLQSGFQLQGFLSSTWFNLDMLTEFIKAFCTSTAGSCHKLVRTQWSDPVTKEGRGIAAAASTTTCELLDQG